MTPQRTALALTLSIALPITLFLAVSPAQAQVTAADVVDRASLKAFVDRATALSQSRISSIGDAYAFFDRTFRPEGEWKMGSIYLFVLDADGVIRFHGASMAREGENHYNRPDRSGSYYVRELIRAAEAGGGYVEYYFDNPAVTGDEEEGSLKVGYARLLTFGGEKRIIGSGYYPATSTPIAPPLALLALAALLAGGAFRRLRRR